MGIRACSDSKGATSRCYTEMTLCRPLTLEDLRWLERTLQEKIESTRDIGRQEVSKKQLKVLNRCISIQDGGNTHEPDVRSSRSSGCKVRQH